jgi:hypothetical protein
MQLRSILQRNNMRNQSKRPSSTGDILKRRISICHRPRALLRHHSSDTRRAQLHFPRRADRYGRAALSNAHSIHHQEDRQRTSCSLTTRRPPNSDHKTTQGLPISLHEVARHAFHRRPDHNRNSVQFKRH